jgi:hypothetical protein
MVNKKYFYLVETNREIDFIGIIVPKDFSEEKSKELLTLLAHNIDELTKLEVYSISENQFLYLI